MRSHRRSTLLRSTSVALAAAALAAPAASAGPILEPGSGSVPQGDELIVAEPSPVPARAVTTSVADEFDWGSAAIGAGATGALALLALGGASRISRGTART